jgi:uncharacterized protein
MFWNREKEINLIKKSLGKSHFGILSGRRRIGKTALLRKVIQDFGGIYHQAIEGTATQQIEHFCFDLKDTFPIFANVTPKNWSEFFYLLSQTQFPAIFVIDELPNLLQADSSAASLLQKFIDHDLENKKTLFLISGSSQSMLHSYFFNPSHALYGRSHFHMKLGPLHYKWFCKQLKLKWTDPNTFLLFSLVGGIPHYWNLIPDSKDPIETAEYLYFNPSGLLADEPKNLLLDESITGDVPKAILDVIARGAHRLSEIAGRTGVKIQSLSKYMQVLVDLGLIIRHIPFGENPKNSKKSLYQVEDFCLLFYYGFVTKHRSKWPLYSKKQKLDILTTHCQKAFEIYIRQNTLSGERYWYKDQVEFDVVREDPSQKNTLEIIECKWSKYSTKEKNSLVEKLQNKAAQSPLSTNISKFNISICDQSNFTSFIEND